MTSAHYQREIRTIARQSGWTVTPTRGGHLRLSRPGTGPVFAASTPSDHRALLNTRAMLRRGAARLRAEADRSRDGERGERR